MDWCSPGVETTDRDILGYGDGIPGRLGGNVHFYHIQVDIHALEVLLHHYNQFGTLDIYNSSSWNRLPIQLWQGTPSVL